jgi:WD40 repeat protein
LLSWSHDRTLRSWDTARGLALNTFTGHADRVTTAAVSPDGSWVVSGSRDRNLKLWDLQSAQITASVTLPAEVRCCFFLLDGQSVVAVDGLGRLGCYSVPELAEQGQLITRLPVQCGDLASSGNQIALGCDDGRVHFVSVAGLDQSPLVITPLKTSRRTATVLDRLFGRSRVTAAYSCTCPACGHSFELPATSPGQPAPCPHCRRSLRLSALTRVAAEK